MIDIKNNPKRRIVGYLKEHGSVTAEELSQALQLDIADVLCILFNLERKGFVERPLEPLA